MRCNICGTEESDVQLYPKKAYQFLCHPCQKDTPRKVDKQSFCKAFFNTTSDKVPRGILKEFYSDYKVSTCNLKEYVEACTMRE